MHVILTNRTRNKNNHKPAALAKYLGTERAETYVQVLLRK